jgi:hypothetical protein
MIICPVSVTAWDAGNGQVIQMIMFVWVLSDHVIN